MPERQFSVAVSVAKILCNSRKEFVEALRAAAVARIEASAVRNIYANRPPIIHRAVEMHADDAVYAIGRDGLCGLEAHVRFAVDEIVREALDAARRGAQAK